MTKEQNSCRCAECGKKDADGWALYCVDCMEKINVLMTAQPAQEPVAHSVIAGALFDFMGWLTSRKERIVLSSADEASPAVDAIRDFAKMRGLSLDNAKVREWIEALAQPVQPADLQKRLADLHLYEEIAEHYAKCAISPEALRDWVAERLNTPPQPEEPAKPNLTLLKPFVGGLGKAILEQLISDLEKFCTPPLPVQEPVAYYHPQKGFYFAKPTSVSAPTIVHVEPLALYAAPPQPEEINFCARCGKRTADIHTCTPPQENT